MEAGRRKERALPVVLAVVTRPGRCWSTWPLIPPEEVLAGVQWGTPTFLVAVVYYHGHH